MSIHHGEQELRWGFVAGLLGHRPGPVLWCRSRRTALEAGDPYGPGIAGLGLTPDRLILAEAAKPAELLWAMEEGARTKGPEGRPCVGTGAAEIDEALPWGGLTPGLHEIAATYGDAARAGFVAGLLGRRPGRHLRP